MWLLAAMNLGFMAWVLFDPEPVARFGGLSLETAVAGSELRTMYGGLIGGLGLLNLIGAMRPRRLNAALWATGWAFTGVGVVRLGCCIGLALGGWQLAFAVSEVSAAVVCFWLLHKHESPHAD